MSDTIRAAVAGYLQDKNKSGYASDALIESWTGKLVGLNCERVVLNTLSEQMESTTRLSLGEMIGRVHVAKGSSGFTDNRYPEGSRWWTEIEKAWPKGAKSLGITGYISGRIEIMHGIQCFVMDKFHCHGRNVGECYIKLDFLLSQQGADLMPTTIAQANVEYEPDYCAAPEVKAWVKKQLDNGVPSWQVAEQIGKRLEELMQEAGRG